MISSANPNLRIVGNWAGQVQPGVIGMGFAVAISTSFVQVARVQNRYVLRDGYHRCFDGRYREAAPSSEAASHPVALAYSLDVSHATGQPVHLPEGGA